MTRYAAPADALPPLAEFVIRAAVTATLWPLRQASITAAHRSELLASTAGPMIAAHSQRAYDYMREAAIDEAKAHLRRQIIAAEAG